MTWDFGALADTSEPDVSAPGTGWNMGQLNPDEGQSLYDRWGSEEPVGSAEEVGLLSSNLIDAMQSGGAELLADLSVVGSTISNAFGADIDVKATADWFRGLEDDYRETFTWDRVKDDFDSGGLGQLGRSVAGFILETGAQSIPAMAASLSNAGLGAYIGSLIGNIAQERVKNDGRETVTISDLAAAVPAAATSGMLERIGTQRLLKGVPDAMPRPGWRGVPGEIGRRAATEAAQEAAQEGTEYVGGAAFTQAGIDPQTMLVDAMLPGAIAGGGMGAGVGGAVGVGRALSADTQQIDPDLQQAREADEQNRSVATEADATGSIREDAVSEPRVEDGAARAAAQNSPSEAQAIAERQTPLESETGPTVEQRVQDNLAQVQGTELQREAAARRAEAVQGPGEVPVGPATYADVPGAVQDNVEPPIAATPSPQEVTDDRTTPVYGQGVQPEVQPGDGRLVEASAPSVREDVAAPVVSSDSTQEVVSEIPTQVVGPSTKKTLPATVTARQPATTKKPAPEKSFNELQKQASTLTRTLKSMGLPVPEGARTKKTLPGIIEKAQKAIIERTSALEESTIQPVREQAIRSISDRRGTGYAEADLVLRKTAEALDKVSRKRPEFSQYVSDVESAVKELHRLREVSENPQVAANIFDTVEGIAPVIARMANKPVQAKAGQSFTEATNELLAALNTALPKTQQVGMRPVQAPPTAPVTTKKRKAPAVAAKARLNETQQALSFAADTVQTLIASPSTSIDRLREAVNDLQSIVQGIATDKRSPLSAEQRTELRSIASTLNIDERSTGEQIEGGALEGEGVSAARQPRKEGAPGLQRKLASAAGRVQEVIRAAPARRKGTVTLKKAPERDAEAEQEQQLKDATEQAQPPKGMAELDAPFKSRLPDNQADAFLARLADTFNIPSLDGNSLVAGLLSASQGFGRNDNIRRLRMLAKILEGVDLSHVNIRFDSDMGVRGEYDHVSDTITLQPSILQDPERAFQTTIHELVHAATVKQLHRDNKAARRLEELRSYVDAAMSPTRYMGPTYGAADVYEFVAEGLSNPAFQAQLNDILLPMRLRHGHKGLRSIWDAFVNIVRTALGMQPRANSALDSFLQDAADLFAENALAEGRSHYYLRKGGYIPQADLDVRTGYRRGFKSVGPTREPGTVGGKRDWRLKLRQGGRKVALGTIPRGEILKIWGKDFIDTINNKNPLQEIVYHGRERYGTFRARQSDKSKLMRDIDLATEQRKAATERMYQIALRATMAGLHPDKVWQAQAPATKGRTAGREALHKELYAEFKALPKSTRDLYHRIQRALKRDFDDRRQAMFNLIAKQGGITDNGLIAEIEGLSTDPDKALAQIQELEERGLAKATADKLRKAVQQMSMTLPGAYFPLRRFGNYVVHGRKEIQEEFQTADEADAFVDKMRKQYPGAVLYSPSPDHKVHGHVRFMETHESLEEAQQSAANLKKTFDPNVVADRKENFELPADTPLHELLQITTQETGDAQLTEALRSSLLSLLPETRQLRSALTRQYVEGYSRNLHRALAQHFMAGDRAIASLRHSQDIANAFNDATTLAKQTAARGDSEKSTRMHEVIQSLRERYRTEEQAEAQGWARHVGQIAFLRYLADTSYLMINLLQPIMVTMPQLSGQYGTARANKAMARAYATLMPKTFKHAATTKTRKFNVNIPGLDPSTFIEDLRQEVATRDPEIARLIEVAQRQEVLSSLQAEEMAAVGYGQRPQDAKGAWARTRAEFDDLSRLVSGPSQYVEFMNRLVTLTAAYDLERRANPGDSTTTSQLKAIDHVRDTQIDYSPGNRAPIFRKGLGRVFFTFKMFAFGMYSRLIEYSVRAFKGRSKADRIKGAKQLALFLGTHTAVAGALHGLLIEPLRMAIYAAGLLFDDEDDFKEIWDNPDLYIREALEEQFGKEVGRSIATGLAPSIGPRVGLGGLLFLELPDTSDSATDVMQQIMMGAFGAPGRYAVDIADGIKAINEEGDWNRFIQKTLPLKAGVNLARAEKLSTEGITDRQGNVLVKEGDIGYGEVLLQALGISPSVIGEVYAARDVKYSREKPANQRAKQLRSNYYKAKGAERLDAWRAIQAFNQQNPAHRITYASLRRGLQRRRKQERETRRGVYFHGTDKQRYYNSQTEFADVP